MKKDKQWLFLVVALLLAVSCYYYRCLEITINSLSWYQNYLNFPVDKVNNQSDEITPYVDENQASLNLYALSACLMDADTGRVLYEKDGYTKKAMASTTKIMTLIVALENANLKDTVTVSKNAAKQPPVQMNINTGEQYILEDLLYALMLESYNDVAVAIAEHVGGSVEEFCNMMTEKAREIGALNTKFKTPNGLDAEGHYTTAADLALIGSYAIKNDKFRKIVGTTSYSIRELTKGRTFTSNNKDAFLRMMDGAIGIKTGFTGKAGYCFVGALEQGEKTLVSVVLGSGWPPNKSLKWSDTKKLMRYGLDNYKKNNLIEALYKQQPNFTIPNNLYIAKGQKSEVSLYTKESLDEIELLLREDEIVQAKSTVKPYLTAPVVKDMVAGTIEYYVGDTLFRKLNVYVGDSVKEIDYPFTFREVLRLFY